MDKRHSNSTSPRRASNDESAHRDRWLISYADLMILLFALFVVLYASADRERAHVIAQAMAVELGDAPAVEKARGNGVLPGANNLPDDARSFIETRQRIETSVRENEVLAKRVRVRDTQDGFAISLAEAGFFAIGEADIKSDAAPLIDNLATALGNSNVRVRVEGHTDATPINTARFSSNWQLSAARASDVLEQLAKRTIKSSRLSLAGFGDERPVAPNDSEGNRALNRRVDLVVVRPS